MKIFTKHNRFIIAILLMFLVSTVTKAQVDTAVYTIKQVDIRTDTIYTSCEGSTVQIKNTITTNADHVTWSTLLGGTFDNTNALNPIYTPSPAEFQSGYSTLKVEVIGLDKCSQKIISVTINYSKPATIIISSTKTSVCLGDSVLLSLGGVYKSYLWDNGSTYSTTVVYPKMNVSNSVTVTDVKGCKISGSISVPVLTPLTKITTNTQSQNVCLGNSIILQATFANNFVWNSGDKQPNITVSPTKATTYTVTGYNVQGCFSTASVTIGVSPQPTVAIDVISGKDSICTGASVNLGSRGISHLTYLWSNSFNDSDITVSPSVTTIYSVTATNLNGCKSIASRKISVINSISVSANPSTIKVGQSSDLIVLNGNTCVWDNAISSTQSKITVYPQKTTNYNVSTTNYLGCAVTGSVTVNVNGIAVTGVTVSPQNLSLFVGGSSTLTSTVSPTNATVPSVFWSSSDSSVIKVDQNGNVNAIKAGNCLITATSIDNSKLFGICSISVTATNKIALLKQIKEVDSILLKAPLGLTPGKYPPIAFENLKNDNQNAQSVYSDTKASQAHIDSTVQKLSNAIVLFKASIIYVPSVPVKYVNILEGNQTVQVNKTFSLHAQIYPSNASNQQLKWYFKNAKDTLDKGYLGNGSIVTLTPPQIGNYIIYAYSNEYYISGKDTIFHHDSVSVTVALPISVNKITVNANELKIAVGASDNSIIATVWPLTANNKNLLWNSKDGSIANVDPSTGTIIGIAEGTTIITVASIENPALMQNITVYVTIVSVDKSKLENTLSEADFVISNINESSDLGTEVGQYDKTAWYALNKMYGIAKDELYSQSSTQITVNSTVVNLLKAIASFKNSKVGASLVNSLAIKPGDLTLNISSAPYQLNAIVLPLEASNKSLVWESSDETVVTVDKNGLVTVIGGGLATVKATTTDGSAISESSMITVIVPVKSISLPQFIGLQVDTKFLFTALVLPSNATYKDIVWSSSDKSIASVDNYGEVVALKPGSAKIIAQSADGQVTAMTIVNVSLEAIPLKSITLPDTLHLLLGEIQTLNAIIQPYNATNSIINWTSSNASSLSVDYKGEIVASGIDTVVVYAYSSDNETIFDSTIVYINASKAPEALPIKPITVQEGTTSISIPLSSLVVDDKTNLSNLVFIVLPNDNFTMQIVDDSLIITPNDPNVVVKENISLSVVDQDGQSVSVTIPVSISSGINKAPIISEIPKQAIIVGGNFIPVSLPLYVIDDYTKQEDIEWTVSPNSLFKTSVHFNNLYVEPATSSWIGTDSLLLTAKDKNGATSTKYIQYSISNKANEAPLLIQIPVQEQTNSTAFQPIVLSKYVTDDYTPSSSIAWIASKSNKISITIVGGKAFITVIDKNWTGSDLVVFTATDQGGLSNTVNVFFNQKATVSQITWAGKPEVSFTAERTKVGSKELVKFHGSITGQASDGSEWTFDGGSPAQSYDLNPSISYENPGKFDVLFVAGNNGEIDSSLMADYITVVGITTPDTVICPGKSAVLSVSDKTLTKYQWSNGEKTASITVSPSVDTKYTVTVQSGLVKYYDTVLVSVSKPVTLGNDTAICDGSTLTYTLQGFATYKWNNETSFNKNTFKTSTAQNISVEVIDAFGCVSSSGVEVSVNALPTVNLGLDDSICPSVKKVLDPGKSFSAYVWNDGTFAQTKDVTVSDNYSVTVTDANGCKNSDNVSIVVKQAYAEKLGVATYSDNGSKIILAWERTKGQNTVKYEVLREYETDKYEVIGNTVFNQNSIIVDSTSNSNQQAYKYKLRTFDACGSSVESEPHRTMFAISNYNSKDNVINLQWNRYEGIALTKYSIYELNKKTGDTTKIGSVPASDGVQMFNYTVNKPKDGYQYRVGYSVPYFDPKVTKSDGGPFSQSLSNMAESELVGIDTKVESIVTVYPNPVEDNISISFGSIVNANLEIVNVAGEVVLTKKVAGEPIVLLSVEKLDAGVYYVKTILDDSVVLTQFIKL